LNLARRILRREQVVSRSGPIVSRNGIQGHEQTLNARGGGSQLGSSLGGGESGTDDCDRTVLGRVLLRVPAVGAEKCLGGIPALLRVLKPHLMSRVGEYDSLINRKQPLQLPVEQLQERVGLAA
jgi:hypothetical protein